MTDITTAMNLREFFYRSLMVLVIQTKVKDYAFIDGSLITTGRLKGFDIGGMANMFNTQIESLVPDSRTVRFNYKGLAGLTIEVNDEVFLFPC